MSVLVFIILIICCFGVPLNGIVIWLLGFQINRNPFTVLILNLAIADFALLVFLAIISICSFTVFRPAGITFFRGHLVQSAAQAGNPIPVMVNLWHACRKWHAEPSVRACQPSPVALLAAISIDRCACVLFPIWHRCSRPKHLSSAVCAFFWIFSFLLEGISNILNYVFHYDDSLNVSLIVTSVLSLPLITISTLILFVKICLKPKQIQRGRLLVMILITLLCFLILTLPLHIYMFIHFSVSISWRQFYVLDNYLTLGACLNSSVNPVIYYLVGRKKRAQTQESIKVVFQRVFREDEDPESTEKATNSVSTPL